MLLQKFDKKLLSMSSRIYSDDFLNSFGTALIEVYKRIGDILKKL